MGSWFYNISVRKTETVNEENFKAYWLEKLASKGFRSVDSAEEADCTASIITSADSRWITFASDFIVLENLEGIIDILYPLSSRLGTDALGIACFDSDCAFMNLVNSGENLDAWLNIGHVSEYGINRRTATAKWKNKVSDFDGFKAALKSKSAFAEDTLYAAAEYLGLPGKQAASDYSASESDIRLYFKQDADSTDELPKLSISLSQSFNIAAIDKYNTAIFTNDGGASRGINIYFAGDYVEHDEITFDAWLLRHSSYYDDFWEPQNAIPLILEKQHLADGVWVYTASVSDYIIKPRAPEGLTERQEDIETQKRSINVRFIPHGDPQKANDICVVVAPMQNPAGCALKNVWREAYIPGLYQKHLAKLDLIKSTIAALPVALAEPPALHVYMPPKNMPAGDKEYPINFLNSGSASKGLKIFIAGSFVENGELTFDARLMRRSSFYPDFHAPENSVSLEFCRQQLSDGSLVYAATVKDYAISAREPEGLSEIQTFKERHKREITLYITPHGKGQSLLKTMEISVIAMPLENPNGCGVWNLFDEYFSGKRLQELKTAFSDTLNTLISEQSK